MLAGAFFLIASPALQASSYYWDADGDVSSATGGAGTWDHSSSLWRAGSSTGTLAQWPNADPDNADTVQLAGTAGTLTLNSSSVNINVNNITFGTTGYTIAAPGSGTATLNLEGTTPTIAVGTGSATIAAKISGSAGLNMTGTGTLTLTNSNTFTGGLILNGGTVNSGTGTAAVDAIDALGASNGVVTVNSDSRLYLAGGNFSAVTLAKSFVLNANLVLSGGGGVTIAGAVSGTGGITPISAGHIAARVVTLSSTSNTFTGAINSAQNGNVTVNSLSDAVGSGNIFLGTSAGPGRFSWGSGAVSSLTLNNRKIVMSGTTGNGANVNNANTNAANIVTINSNLGITGAGAKALTLGGANTGNNLFAGIIADGVAPSAVISLIKNDAGKWILSGANTYSGDTTVYAGTLSLSNSNSNNDSSVVTIAATGATLNLNFSGTDTVRKLVIGATQMAPGVYKAVGSAAAGTPISQITGTGTLTVIGITLGIGDNKNGRPLVAANSTVTYTLTFSEDMDASTVTAAAFGNAGTSTIGIGAITQISPRVFTMLVTPSDIGTLRLQVLAGAILKDAAGNAMVTTSAILDDTTMTVYTSETDSTTPTLRGVSAVSNNSGSSLSLALPAGVVAGDLLIANIAQYGASSGNPTASGWTLISGKSLGGNASCYGAVLYKVATATEAGPYAFTLTGTTPAAAGVILAFSSVDTSGGPFDVSAGALYTGGASATQVGPATQLTTVSPNARVLMLGMAVSANSATWSNWLTTSPGALAELYDVQGSGAGNNATSLGAAWALQAVPGATGTGGATLSSAARNGSILLALKPSYNAALLTALTELKNHINGTISLSAAQIEAHKLTIDAQKSLFGSSSSAIAAALDLVATYDSVAGPLWVAQNGFTRASVTNDIPWTICTVMQNIIDLTYTAANVVNHADLLSGFKFGSSAHFPGACAPPVDPNLTNTAVINANFPNTWGWPTFEEAPVATKPTGNYLAPGSIATVTVPPSMVGRGYKIRVGCHKWDMSGRPTLARLDRVSVLYDINATETRVANPFGGGIYIEVPAYVTDVGIVNIQIANAVRSPYFSAKSFHTTTPTQWLAERANPAPWADFQSEKFMMQVPTSWISAMPDPTQLMKDWDLAADTCNDLMGFPHDRGKETMYDQVDVNLHKSVYNPGYPAGNNTYSISEYSGGYSNSYLVRGPQVAAHYHFHELGHSYYMGFNLPQFPGDIESVINLHQVAVWNQRFGYSLDDAFRASLSGYPAYATLDTTAVAWMMCDNFVSGVTMAKAEKDYQLKGHAKFVDVARMFGWNKLNQYMYSFTSEYESTGTFASDTDSMLLRLSKSVGFDIRPLFDFWGVPPLNNTTLGAAIATENLHPSAAIYDALVHYKSLIPADNAAFRTFASSWWSRQPLLTGGTEESNHAARWDTYNATAAAAAAARAQATIDLYFPNGRPPSLVGSAIIDDKSGGPVAVNTPVTYTVTFSEDMNASTVSTADFGNAGSAAVTIGTVNETTPGVFTVPVTPTTSGTLQLRVNASAVLADPLGDTVDTTVPITDDTVITVLTKFAVWAGNGPSFGGDLNGDGVADGMAWLLGSTGVSLNARALLPTSNQSSGNLVVVFNCLNADNRGSAVLNLQYSQDLGIADQWDNHTFVVPDATGSVDGVNFVITPSVNTNNVRATIPGSAAGSGKIFVRLSGVLPAP